MDALSAFEKEVVEKLEQTLGTQDSICFLLDVLIKERLLPLDVDFFGVTYSGIAFDADEKAAIVSKVSQVLTAGSSSLNIDELKVALVAKVVDIVLDFNLFDHTSKVALVKTNIKTNSDI